MKRWRGRWEEGWSGGVEGMSSRGMDGRSGGEMGRRGSCLDG